MDTTNLARYALGADGTVRRWLACGPRTSPLSGLEQVVPADGSPFGPNLRWCISNAPDSLELKARAYRELERPAWQPAPGRLPGATPVAATSGPAGADKWRFVATEADAMIDMSLFNFALSWMEGWLYSTIWAPEAGQVDARLLTVNPAQVWLNGEQALHYTRFGYVEPLNTPLKLELQAGWNELWLYGVTIGWREARLALGLRLENAAHLASGIPIGKIDPGRWGQAEITLENLTLAQGSFARLPVSLEYAASADSPAEFVVRAEIPLSEDGLKLPGAAAEYAALAREERLRLQPGEFAPAPVTQELAAGIARLSNDFPLLLKMRPAEDLPLVSERELWGRGERFYSQPQGEYDARRQEALEHLAAIKHRVLGSVAAVRLGKSAAIEPDAIDFACRFMEQRYDCADFYALDLMALLHLYGDTPALRPQDQARIERAFRDFKFWVDEPGLDAMCFHTENHQILFHVNAYLAGKRWPEWVFSNSGWNGRQQQVRAWRRMDEWIHRRLAGSFSEWDSSSYLALDAFALLALVEFSGSRSLQRQASALLDKLFFSLACQSYRGMHGSTHGRSYVAGLKSARVENTSGMQRIAWGMGNLNGETQATGLLALAQNYRVPEIIQQIGADLPPALLTRAHSSGRYRPQFDLHYGDWEVNTLTYRTPQGMLSAALDYMPGEWGWQEHLWQATLSPEAVVFSNHPGNSQEHGNARPNYWAGSARMPRVAMHANTVISLYNRSLAGGLGFTHAYFPSAAFDEHRLEAEWAFARVGEGYLALAGDGELRLTQRGCHAGQELRSAGPGQVWLAHLGNAAGYGNFAAFCRQISASRLECNGLEIGWQAPSGEQIEFAWQGPLRVNGQIEALGDFPHYQNLYTDTAAGAREMALQHAGQSYTIQLDRPGRQHAHPAA